MQVSIPQTSFPRTIKSFIRRERKLKNPNLFSTLWEHYGLDLNEQLLNVSSCFTQTGPCTLEIGFGSGESLLQQAQSNPNNRYLGIEVYRAGIFQLLFKLQKNNIHNLKILEGNAVDIVCNCIPDKSIDALHILFSDPWPKKKHHKRRLIQSSFINVIVKKLKSNGLLYLATDWEPYAYSILHNLEVSAALKNVAGKYQFSSRIATLPLTKFEQRGLNQGRSCWYFQFEKVSDQSN